MLISNTENIPENNGSGQAIIPLVVPVTFGIIIIIIITAILVLPIHKLFLNLVSHATDAVTV